MLAFLDLDGVVVDFIGGALRQHGWNDLNSATVSWTFWRDKGLSDTDFWESKNHEFWANLEITEDGLEILNVVERIVGRNNIFICSSPCLTKGCTSGKATWVDRHLPVGYGQRLVLTGRKEVMAGKDRILIDDHDENLQQFASAGGRTCCVPRPWNKMREHPPVESVVKQLERIMQR